MVDHFLIPSTHAGQAIAEDDDFFNEPTEKLGSILSGFTDMKTSSQPKSPLKKAIYAAVGSGIGLAIALIINLIAELRYSHPWAYLCIVLITLFGLLLGYAIARFSHKCTYCVKTVYMRPLLTKAEKRNQIFANYNLLMLITS